MNVPTATEISCSHDEEYCSDQGPDNVNPPEPNAALSKKCFVANGGSHDARSIIPEPVSSRTRRKLLLAKSDDKQVTTSAEVCHEMESSSEDENIQAATAFERSERQVHDSQVNDANVGTTIHRLGVQHATIGAQRGAAKGAEVSPIAVTIAAGDKSNKSLAEIKMVL